MLPASPGTSLMWDKSYLGHFFLLESPVVEPGGSGGHDHAEEEDDGEDGRHVGLPILLPHSLDISLLVYWVSRK